MWQFYGFVRGKERKQPQQYDKENTVIAKQINALPQQNKPLSTIVRQNEFLITRLLSSHLLPFFLSPAFPSLFSPYLRGRRPLTQLEGMGTSGRIKA